MASYTMELRRVCEIYGRSEVENWFKDYNLTDFLTPQQISQIEKYGVFSKEKLASMIVDHYYMREIGLETPALFKHYAKVKMQEIMESKLLKIYTKFLEYDPLSSVDYTEEFRREINSEGEGESKSKTENQAESFNITNDTPQTKITKQDVNNGFYASATGQTETTGEAEDQTNTSNKNKTIETYTHSMKGDNGVIVTNQYLVREFRELAVNFNQEIIEELNPLFMGLY